jgi:2-polyprenyl-3-methyl-5-hydroxy-6-metoxy-1,4-benzoquinol methylase
VANQAVPENILDTDKYERYGAYHWPGVSTGWRIWRYSPRSAANYQVVERVLSRLLPRETTTARILDLACGDSVMTFRMARRQLTVVGVDIEYVALRHGQHEQQRRGVTTSNLAQASGGMLPFPTGAFAACIAMELIEHVGGDLRSDMLREIGRVLRPGGALVLTTPQKRGETLSSPYHVEEFSALGLERLLSDTIGPTKVYGYLSERATRMYFLGGKWLKPLRLGWKLVGRVPTLNPYSRLDPKPTIQHEGLLAVAAKR